MDPEVIVSAVEEDYCAVARFSGRLQVVSFYMSLDDATAAPLEVRAWRSEKSVSKRELAEILSNWLETNCARTEIGISSEELRSVSFGALWRQAQAVLHDATVGTRETLEVPSEAEIDEIIEQGCVPKAWRNSRDFRAQARQLRGVIAYLDAVYGQQSAEPMKHVSEETGLDIVASRKLIQQARERGFLTKSAGVVGGLATDWARACADQMNMALIEARKRK